MRTWREFRISREGRHGFLLVLPVFEDTDAPEDAAKIWMVVAATPIPKPGM